MEVNNCMFAGSGFEEFDSVSIGVEAILGEDGRAKGVFEDLEAFLVVNITIGNIASHLY